MCAGALKCTSPECIFKEKTAESDWLTFEAEMDILGRFVLLSLRISDQVPEPSLPL
jgi:hypothetical protein